MASTTGNTGPLTLRMAIVTVKWGRNSDINNDGTYKVLGGVAGYDKKDINIALSGYDILKYPINTDLFSVIWTKKFTLYQKNVSVANRMDMAGKGVLNIKKYIPFPTLLRFNSDSATEDLNCAPMLLMWYDNPFRAQTAAGQAGGLEGGLRIKTYWRSVTTGTTAYTDNTAPNDLVTGGAAAMVDDDL